MLLTPITILTILILLTLLTTLTQLTQLITLIEDENIISKEEEVAETLNNYFLTVTDSLGLTENSEIITGTEGVTDPIDQAFIKYSNHPSIRKICSLVQSDGLFHFNNNLNTLLILIL